MPFACSICEQESARICVSCTKDACDNHICESCGCCSDCCDCDVPLTEPVATPVAAMMSEPALAREPAAEMEALAGPAPEAATGVDLPVAPAAEPTEAAYFAAVTPEPPAPAPTDQPDPRSASGDSTADPFSTSVNTSEV